METPQAHPTPTTTPPAETVITIDSGSPPPNPSTRIRRTQYPTIDGPFGVSEQDSVEYARRFFTFGFLLLPFLWALNCFYFWPVLRHSRYYSHSQPQLRRYVIGSAIGFTVFATVLSTWAFTFAFGGERVIGPVWEDLVMYNVADKWGLSGFI
ncbi:hypothetical protein LIER_29929 [Lithospermum erythrorhizon]|uniref:Gamma-secretase subunit PEN-2 n=1 Tax=Lithospermum erythrorhizon TaxID=34254 RepID=A0AAV3RKV8_LITER